MTTSFRLFWAITSFFALPYVAWRYLRRPDFRKDFSERLGCYPGWLKNIGETNPIWFHAASVGEVYGIKPVIEQVRAMLPESAILVSTTTVNGKKQAMKIPEVSGVVLLPLDVPTCVARFLMLAKPQIAIFNETEIWPNMLLKLSAMKIDAFVINGRISNLSYPNYLRFRFLFRPLLESFRKVFVQTSVDRERYIKLGAIQENVIVTGSTKYENKAPVISEEARREFLEDIKIPFDVPVIVAGSVREVEDLEVILSYKAVLKDFPALRLIVAPRHMTQVEKIKTTCRDLELRWALRSSVNEPNPQVVILDTMGELSKCYSVATLAFIGGSLVNIGGHNPVEAMQYGVPIIIGQYYANVRDVIELMSEENGIGIVSSAKELEMEISNVLSNPLIFNKYKNISFSVSKKLTGVSSAILPILFDQAKPDPHGNFSESRRKIVS